jgi:hypothetical protein
VQQTNDLATIYIPDGERISRTQFDEMREQLVQRMVGNRDGDGSTTIIVR